MSLSEFEKVQNRVAILFSRPFGQITICIKEQRRIVIPAHDKNESLGRHIMKF